MHRSLAPAVGRLAAGLALALAVLLPSSASAREQQPTVPQLTGAELAHQRAIYKDLHKLLILQKAKAKIHEGREYAELVKKAKKGNKKARLELQRIAGEHLKKSDESVEPAAEIEVAPRAQVAPATANGTLSIPTNVRANSTAGDLAGAGQAEENIGVLGSNVLVAWNDGQGFNTGGDTQGFAWSTNGGATFTDGGDVPHPPGFALWAWTSDPVVTVNEKTGEFWYCGLVDVDATHNGIAVARGKFNAGTFAFDSVFIVRSALNSSFFLDKQWMVADTATGNLYVVNTTFTTTGDQIDFYRSTNGGRTWSSALQLSSTGDNGLVQGPRPAVGPNGEVYVVWSAIGQVDDFDYMRVRKSTNGGVSFGAEANASQFISNFGSGAPGFNRERGLSFPSITVDRTTGAHRGRVYVSWNESWDWLDDGFPAVTSSIVKFESDPVNNNTTNNTPATATPFTIGQVLKGTLQTTGSTTDLDYFSVAMNAGDRIFVYADSFTALRAFTLRMFAPNPDANQRLCYSGVTDSTSTQSYSIWIFQAPTTGTYYLRIAGISRRTMTYRIRTTVGVKGAELGRDQRDALTSWSDNGTTWSTPTMMNTDAVGFDNWLPEVGVGADGLVYGMWFDHRDDLYGSRAHVYTTRSYDGGTTWDANQRVTSVQSNFSTSASNIAPNHGDYSHVAASATKFYEAWSDARNADVDVYVAGLATTSAVSSCPNDTTVAPTSSIQAGWQVANDNPLFGGTYGITLTSDRNWTVSGPATLAVPAEGSAFYTANVTVPDTAAAGVNHVCLTLTSPGGVVIGQCCYAVTVQSGQTAVGDHLTGFALAPAWPNPAHGSARIAYSLPGAGHVRLAVYDLTGARVRTLVDADRAAGVASATWDGRDTAGNSVRAGAYFVRLEFAGRSLTQRLVMTR